MLIKIQANSDTTRIAAERLKAAIDADEERKALEAEAEARREIERAKFIERRKRADPRNNQHRRKEDH